MRTSSGGSFPSAIPSDQGQPYLQVIALTLPGTADPAVAIAASRAGAIGVVDLQYMRDESQALAAVARLAQYGRGRVGVKVEDASPSFLTSVLLLAPPHLNVAVVTPTSLEGTSAAVQALHGRNVHVLVEATRIEEAELGERAGADALIAKGNESGGRVGSESTFILLQRLLARFRIPIWAQGGIGEYTAGACQAAGAAGVVLDAQLALARESPLGEVARSVVERMDGSETMTINAEAGTAYRLYQRPPATALRALPETLAATPYGASRAGWRAELAARAGWDDPGTQVLILGQDAAFAAPLARRYVTVGGIVQGIREAANRHVRLASSFLPLDEGAPLARAHGTRYPIVQGPMTRVSDVPDFAVEVAQAGALPFLALALMRKPQVEALLEETQSQLADRPWGVGILGFVPQELRDEQLEVVRRIRPPFALIAGGRPDQARSLEREGIPTYLHVPSPGLLEMFLADGARRFVFEGRECGGHVGPRSSFVLWNTMIEVLLRSVSTAALAECHVLFAGGIHDALSSAMVAATAAPLAEKGVRIGVLLGTAYLFTREAVSTGAIVDRFQREAINCSGTVLLESGIGHVTRCVHTPYANRFDEEKTELARRNIAPDEVRNFLEELNIGRLRIASKGVTRSDENDPEAPRLVPLSDDRQFAEGLYMIGQAAALRTAASTIAEVHREVSAGASERLRAASFATDSETAEGRSRVAIVGMACLMPKAQDVRGFWQNILNKTDAVGEIPSDRWDWHRYFDSDPNAPDKIYSRHGGFLDDIVFDPTEYGMPPNSLTSIEPLQLLTLHVVRAALDDAGYSTRAMPRHRTAVILGAGGGVAELGSLYAVRSALPRLLDEVPGEVLVQLPEWTEDSFAGILLNVAAGRVANRFDFGGVNYTVDAACASSLAAIQLATRELETGNSDVVITGGIDTAQNPFAYLCFSKTHALSPTGRCRTFDAGADGIAISEGLAILVLKRLHDAERDGDRIYAVIDAVAGSSDGRDKGLTAPRPEGQALALERAYAKAGFSPATVGLVEAHGTGTVAGDQAEIAALRKVFEAAGATSQSCAVGSVKSMVGHTKCAAGAAGLIKVALALHHKVLPPTANVDTPNPKVGFAQTPFYVNSEARPWVNGSGHPRRAAVSAFGFGGTNFHAVVEEYQGNFVESAVEAPSADWPCELFVWQADSRDGLLAALEPYRKVVADAPQVALRDLAYTLSRQGARGALTLSLVATSVEDLGRKLQESATLLSDPAMSAHSDPRGIFFNENQLGGPGRLALLFPGQGSQYPDMLRELTLHFHELRERFELANRVLQDRLPSALSSYVYPPPSFTDEERQRRQDAVTQTNVAQPALGAVDLGLFHLLSALGVTPDQVGGHSYGEYVALCVAGVFDEETLYMLSEARGRCIIEAIADEPGTMAAVLESESRVRQSLDGVDGVWIANTNAPRQTIISGTTAGIAQAIDQFSAEGITARRIAVACAFHSPLVNTAADRLGAVLAGVEINAPCLPVFSNTTAAAYPKEPAAIRDMLREHLVNPVRFADEVEAMYENGARIFVEVGPRSALTGMVDQILDQRPHLALAADGGRAGRFQLLLTLGQLSAHGVAVDLTRLFSGRGALELDLAKTVTPARLIRSTAWVVNGSRARPLQESVKRPAVAIEHEQSPSRQASGGDAPRTPRPIEPPTSPPLTPAVPRSAEVSQAIPGDVDAIVIQFQQLMGQFLETQQNVMRAYLQATPDQAGSLPDVKMPAIPVPAPMKLSGPAGELEEAVKPIAHDPGHERAASDAPGGPSQSPPGDPQQITAALLQILSDRTGYPVEMLGLDLNIEAELGIDSIKRLEVLGTFQRMHIPPDRWMPPEMTEDLSRIKTLRGIVERIASILGTEAPAVPKEATPTPAQPKLAGANGANNPAPTQDGELPRFILTPTDQPLSGEGAGPLTGIYVITDDETGTAQGLRAELLARGANVVVVTMGEASYMSDDGICRADLTEPAAVAELVGWIRRQGPIGGLIHLLPLRPEAALGADPLSWQTRIRRDVRSLFLLLKTLGPDLRQAGGRLLVATSLGGAFGTGRRAGTPFSPGHAGVAGLVKTCAVEWGGVTCRVVDFEASASPPARAEQLLAELTTADHEAEVGYLGSRRIKLLATPSVTAPHSNGSGIDSDWVFLMTGGARGITARVALELARQWRPTLVLLGRAARPDDEDLSTRGIPSTREGKAALMAVMRQRGELVTPATVESAYARLTQDREIRANIAALEKAGARVLYVQADVRDATRVGQVVDDVYARFGRLDAVIHGAGVIEDRLIEDKELDSFDRVFDTKVVGALALAQAVKPDVKLVLLFSSVAAHAGNTGQADYGAANEVLNKLAALLDEKIDGHVESVMWGPWRTGMVSEEVEAKFARSGVVLITPDAGARAFVRELDLFVKGQTEVIVGEGPWRTGRRLAPPIRLVHFQNGLLKTEATLAEANLRLDPAVHTYLTDHKLDGTPVLPAAVAMELMAELAQRRWPLVVAGIDGFRVLKGVVLEKGQPRNILVRAELDAASQPSAMFLNVSIVDTETNALCYRARLELRERLPAAQVVSLQPLDEARPYPISVEAAYEQLLFHGPSLRGIASVVGIGPSGVDAILTPSMPRSSVVSADGASWIVDPVVIDSAFQLAILWARAHLDSTPLPAGFRSFRRFAPLPNSPVRCEFRVRATPDGQTLTVQYHFRDEKGRLLAVLEDLELTCNPSLNRLAGAFAAPAAR